MGGLQSNAQLSACEQYAKMTFVRHLNQNQNLMYDPATQQHLISVQNTFPSEDLLIKFSTENQKKLKISHQYYVSPVKHFLMTSTNFCSKQHKFVQLFPNFDYTLSDEIQSRREQSRNFNEKQIWSILCSCVLVMAHFTREEISHLSLNPKDIVLTNTGQVMILASELSQYQFNYLYEKGFYYAPETLKMMKNQTSFQNGHFNKPAVFTLGMSILGAILTTDLSDLYSEDYSLNYGQIREYLSQIETKQIREILQKMLKPAPYDRISFPELQQMLYDILEQSKQVLNNQQYNDKKQLEKLQNSIYRLKTAQINENNQNKSNNIVQNQVDEENSPDHQKCSEVFMNYEQENIDEEASNMKISNNTKTFEETKSSNTSFLCANRNPISKQRHPLQQKTNQLYLNISEQGSLQIVEKNKSCYALMSNKTKTSYQNGSYYVTEQYSRGRYEGYKENGMRQGFGTFYYELGGKYSGEWYENKMFGRGALYYSNGELAYEGQWKQDQLNGYGVLYNENPAYTTKEIDWHNLGLISQFWVKYQGFFKNDMKHGQGTIYLTNGEYFRGEFNENIPNGEGIYRNNKDNIVKGVWMKGIFFSK